MGGKTAVIIIHGIGEQVPMETITSFVETVWTDDDSLIDRKRPDPDTGVSPRTRNAAWSKPDRRTDSFELRRITTEETQTGRRVEFFEYYWAHRISNTTWKQVQSWFLDLMLRNPFTRVPKGLRFTWTLMWCFSLVIAALWCLVAVYRPSLDQPAGLAVIALSLASVAGPILMAKLVSHVGDVPRYVKAKPENIAIRETIRQNGVRLLETLMGFDRDGNLGEPPYDRIVMVGHSLGTIVAYDILTLAFARHNDRLGKKVPQDLRQPHRAAMEALIRKHHDDGSELPLDEFRELQDLCRKEMQALGGIWPVSDFITLGSPLTHAEFLMARDKASLDKAKRHRILPTCPPTLEYDGTTKLRHFSYHPPALDAFGDGKQPEHPRFPHHAALFAYTMWTNLYSPHRFTLWGDVISGPICHAFGIPRGANRSTLCGVKDIAVLPSTTGSDQDRKTRFLTHLKYWNSSVGRSEDDKAVIPLHIAALREALDLQN